MTDGGLQYTPMDEPALHRLSVWSVLSVFVYTHITGVDTLPPSASPGIWLNLHTNLPSHTRQFTASKRSLQHSHTD